MKNLKSSVLILAAALLLAGVMHQFGHHNNVEEAGTEASHFASDCVLVNLADTTDLTQPFTISDFTARSIECAIAEHRVTLSYIHYGFARGPPSFYKS
jgi:hypothetical protein